MADAPILSDKEIAFLRALLKHKVQFMLVGLAAATLQGAPVVTQDVDLWFENLQARGIKKALTDVGGTYVPPMQHYPPAFAGASLELFDIVTHMAGLAGFAEEKKYCRHIRLDDLSVPVLSLERIIKSKRAANREKDKLVLPVLEDTLLTAKAIGKK